VRVEEHGFSVASSAPFFSWNGRSAISTNSIRNTFRDHLVPRLALDVPAGSTAPRVHSLRHSFAVRTLLRWYREGQNPTTRLHHLSTFMGHVNPNTTAVYLTITSDLLQEANQRFESFAPVSRQLLQPPPLPRITRQLHPGRRLLRSAAPGPVRKGQDQATHAAASQKGVPGCQRGLGQNHEPSLNKRALLSETF
jgi:hypothetical protein